MDPHTSPQAHAELPGLSQLEPAVRLFKALAHDSRVLVLAALGRRGPLPAGELQRVSGLEQSALSHQLRILRECRLVSAERRGKQVIYALHDAHVARIVEDALQHTAEDPAEDPPAPAETD